MKRKRVFTFVEVLVTISIVAVLLPVLTRAINLAARIQSTSEREHLAIRLADRKLSELVLTGDWFGAESMGFFEEHPEYTWELLDEPFEDSSLPLTRLELVVFFPMGNNVGNVALSTIVASYTVEQSQ